MMVYRVYCVGNMVNMEHDTQIIEKYVYGVDEDKKELVLHKVISVFQ